MRQSADVIIAGAGPAGAATALLLARAGVDVLLLDRAAFPRAKPCGDCLSAGASDTLRRMGLLDLVLAAPHAQLRGWRIVAPDGSAFDATFPPANSGAGRDDGAGGRALTVERSVFDAILVDAAIRAGARFEQQAITDVVWDAHGRVTGVLTRAGVRAGRITVGADGLRSVVARRLGTRTPTGSLRKLSLTFHTTVSAAGDIGEMHVGDGICAGIAPVDRSGRCNLTLVADSARFGRAVAADRHAFACSAVETLPRLAGRVSGGDLLHVAPLASGPFDRPVHPIAFDGAVLVGDAAGYYDPFTGQGVYQALASADRLAPCIVAAIRGGHTRRAAFDSYVRERRALLRGARAVQRGIDTVLRRPALANRAIARIRRAPGFGRALISVTGDVAPAHALLSARALSSLLLPTRFPENAA